MLAHTIESRAKGAASGNQIVIDKVEINPAVDDSIFHMAAATTSTETKPGAAKAKTKAGKKK